MKGGGGRANGRGIAIWLNFVFVAHIAHFIVEYMSTERLSAERLAMVWRWCMLAVMCGGLFMWWVTHRADPGYIAAVKKDERRVGADVSTVNGARRANGTNGVNGANGHHAIGR